MGSQSSTQTFVPGRLIASPANTTAPGYGGTELGNFRSLAVRPRFRFDPRTLEERGSEVVDGILLSHEASLGVVFNGWDSAARTRIFMSAESGGVLSIPGSSKPGTWVGARAFPLLFVPLVADPDAANVLAVYIPQAVPMTDVLELQLSSYSPLMLGMRFWAKPTSSGPAVKIGPAASVLA